MSGELSYSFASVTKPKVHKFDMALRGFEPNIAWLDITMNDIFFMGCLQSIDNL